MPAIQPCPEPRQADPDFAAGDFALAQLSDGRLVVGVAPFRHAAEPSADGVSFYTNDFALTDPQPWRIPDSWDELDSPEELAAREETHLPPLEWAEPRVADFEAAFTEIKEALSAGELVKAVPAVAACAPIPEGGDLAPALIDRARDPGLQSSLYAFREGGRGFVGLTPERLFRMDSETLHTMALAGTAEPGQGASFENDAKEREEHRLVVEALRRRLDEFGQVSEGQRQILDVGGMIHFLTRFDVRLSKQPQIRDVIAALHPTPAVGVVPRNANSLSRLQALRGRLGVPAAFGAPFGVKVGGSFEASVSIRGLFWEDDELFLPAGCGLVEASELQREWAELELKRRWVKSAFGID